MLYVKYCCTNVWYIVLYIVSSIRVSISSSFDKYFGSISGLSKELLLCNHNSPLLLGCNKTGAIIIVFWCENGAKYLL